MNTKINLPNYFKKQLLCFIEELKIQVPEMDDLKTLKMLIKCADENTLINDFINKLNTTRKLIEDRKDEFFKNFFSDPILMSIICLKRTLCNQKQNLTIENIWFSGRFSENDKKLIWSWIDLFVSISDKYNKK
jgi:hypothetical protein